MGPIVHLCQRSDVRQLQHAHPLLGAAVGSVKEAGTWTLIEAELQEKQGTTDNGIGLHLDSARKQCNRME